MKVLVAKMGNTGIEVTFEGNITYRELVRRAGFEDFTALMADGFGYVNADEPVSPTVTTVILSAPKFEAGALPAGLRLVDADGREYAPVVEEEEEEEEEEEVDDTRKVTVAKMGQAGIEVAIRYSIYRLQDKQRRDNKRSIG